MTKIRSYSGANISLIKPVSGGVSRAFFAQQNRCGLPPQFPAPGGEECSVVVVVVVVDVVVVLY